MKSIGIIPLRKGSKTIKGKNKKRLLGRPLFCWITSEAILSNLTQVIIYTDDEEIIHFIKKEYPEDKVSGIMRPEKTATDTASTEFALETFLSQYKENYDILCLLQATSPFTKAADINACLSKFSDKNVDSVLSVVKSKRFLWENTGKPINYDYFHRPRRQDFEGFFVENGAIYMTKRECFEKTKNRISGTIVLHQMCEESYYEIDEQSDWIIAEALLKKSLICNKQNTTEIKALICDIDGVFTNAESIYSADGEFGKSYSLRDGMGLELLRKSGVQIIIITSEDSEIVRQRMKKLKIDDYYPGIKDKYFTASKILAKKNIQWNNTAYIGDDINDQTCILSAGWGLVPVDGEPEIINDADITLPAEGGKRVIRKVVAFIQKYNNRFML